MNKLSKQVLLIGTTRVNILGGGNSPPTKTVQLKLPVREIPTRKYQYTSIKNLSIYDRYTY